MLTTLEKLIAIRKNVWDEQPYYITEYLKSKEGNHPAAGILYGEARTRLCAECLWYYEVAMTEDKISVESAHEWFPVYLNHFARLIDMTGYLHETASIIREIAETVKIAEKAEIIDLSRELRIYLTRICLWIDLYIPWQAANAEIRATKS